MTFVRFFLILCGRLVYETVLERFPRWVFGEFYRSLKYLIRTNFREALISRFSRFVKNREIKDSLKLGYAKIKHAKFNTLL